MLWGVAGAFARDLSFAKRHPGQRSATGAGVELRAEPSKDRRRGCDPGGVRRTAQDRTVGGRSRTQLYKGGWSRRNGGVGVRQRDGNSDDAGRRDGEAQRPCRARAALRGGASARPSSGRDALCPGCTSHGTRQAGAGRAVRSARSGGRSTRGRVLITRSAKAFISGARTAVRISRMPRPLSRAEKASP